MTPIRFKISLFQPINHNLIFAQTAQTVATPNQQQQYYPIELWGSVGLLGVGFLALARSEMKRFDRRRDLEAQQAEKYVRDLQSENQRLEAEVVGLRNAVMGLRVRLARSEGPVINSGELRRQEKSVDQ